MNQYADGCFDIVQCPCLRGPINSPKVYPILGVVQRFERAEEVRQRVGLVPHEYGHENGVGLADVGRRPERGQSHQDRRRPHGHGRGHRSTASGKFELAGYLFRNGANPVRDESSTSN